MIDASINGGSASGNGADGVIIEADAPNVVLAVAGINASDNGANGITIPLDATDSIDLTIEDVTTDDNLIDGINIVSASPTRARSAIALSGINSSGNVLGDGVEIDLGDNDGPVDVALADIVASDNGDNSIELDAGSDHATVTVSLDGATIGDNGGSGLVADLEGDTGVSVTITRYRRQRQPGRRRHRSRGRGRQPGRPHRRGPLQRHRQRESRGWRGHGFASRCFGWRCKRLHRQQYGE